MEGIEYNLFRTVQVIQMDDELQSMFVKKFPTDDFNTIVEAAKNGLLNKESSEYAEGIYQSIILNKKALKELYMRNILSPSLPSKTAVKKTVKTKATDKMPKEYNKTRVEADIKENGGVATEFHKAMLALNDMKNIHGRLNNKGKRQRYGNGTPLTDVECREIIAVVAIIKNRLNKIK